MIRDEREQLNFCSGNICKKFKNKKNKLERGITSHCIHVCIQCLPYIAYDNIQSVKLCVVNLNPENVPDKNQEETHLFYGRSNNFLTFLISISAKRKCLHKHVELMQ